MTSHGTQGHVLWHIIKEIVSVSVQHLSSISSYSVNLNCCGETNNQEHICLHINISLFFLFLYVRFKNNWQFNRGKALFFPEKPTPQCFLNESVSEWLWNGCFLFIHSHAHTHKLDVELGVVIFLLLKTINDSYAFKVTEHPGSFWFLLHFS